MVCCQINTERASSLQFTSLQFSFIFTGESSARQAVPLTLHWRPVVPGVVHVWGPTDWLTDSIRVSCSQLTCQGERENFLTLLSLSLISVSPTALSRLNGNRIALQGLGEKSRRVLRSYLHFFNTFPQRMLQEEGQYQPLYWKATSRISLFISIYLIVE